MKLKLIVILLCIRFVCQAQIPKHEMGFEAGPNFYALSHKVKYKGNTINKEKYLGAGYCFGLTYLRNFDPKSTFRISVNYEFLGYRHNTFGTNTNYKSSIVYLSVPVLYQYQLSKGNAGYYFNTGFSVMNCFMRGFEQKPYTFDVSFIVGVGFKYRFSEKICLGIELRNNLLLGKFWNGHSYVIGRGYKQGSYIDYDYQNHTTVMFSLAFKLGSKQIE